MIGLLIAAQLLSFTQLHAADSPPIGPKKKRHYHKQMTFVDDQIAPLGTSQKSTSPRSCSYVGLQSRDGKTLEIYLHNTKTVAYLPVIEHQGEKFKLNAIVHVIRPKQ